MSNSAIKKKKALSGATMGMRFMQRNMAATATTATKPKSSSSSKHNPTKKDTAMDENDGNDHDDYKWEINKQTQKQKMNQDKNGANGNENDTANNNANGNENDDGTTAMDIDTPNSSSSSIPVKTQKSLQQNMNKIDSTASATTTTNEVMPLFEIASQSDMYGISSEIIGRRSFNEFNKSVEETYQAAIYARRKSKLDQKVEKEQISDEELLKRYEQYVKGNGTSNPFSSNKVANDIGNLKNKVAAKKRKR